MSDGSTGCDEYCCNHGCNQGRNCPARRKRIEEVKRLLDEDDDLRPTLLDFALCIVGAGFAIIVLYTLAQML